MNCEHVEELLSAYLDNTLAPDEHLSVARHLQDCSKCSTILADFRYFDTLLADLPPIGPDAALRDRIFSSPEYLELTGTFDIGINVDRDHAQVQRDTSSRPRLVALPGGRSSSGVPTPTVKTPSLGQKQQLILPSARQQRGNWGLHVMQVAIAAVILLTLGVGGLIGWNLWQEQNSIANTKGAITPPANLLARGPLPEGMHFVFLRDGKLWSAPADGSTQAERLTPDAVTVASNWAVSPALPGHSAGDILAYIDLRQAFVHTIRSDGQRDTLIQQPLLKAGIQPASVWDTETGAALLNSLTWSKDGNMLAFVADPAATGHTGLYIYSRDIGMVQAVPLPVEGSVSHPVWSPDGIRVAFELAHDGVVSILDYNTQNHGMLTITESVSSPGNSNDTILTLDWSPSVDMPAITWSVGVIGQVHSIWLRRVGMGGAAVPGAITVGKYAQAIYSRNGDNGVGSWLLVTPAQGHAANIWRIDVTPGAVPMTLTSGKQVSVAQWSPDGMQVNYLDAVASGVGALHIVNLATTVDTLIAYGVTNEPVPAWSADGRQLVYSTGTQTVVVNTHTSDKLLSLKLHGPASTFVWSATSPSQLIVALSDGQPGVYLVDTKHNTSLQVDTHGINGPIIWTQVP